MESFLGVKALMDETLQGEVTLEAKKIFGDVSSIKGAMKQLRDNERYTIHTAFGRSDFFCVIGYWFPNRNPDDPVWLGIVLTSNPKSKIRKEIIAAFRSLVSDKGHGWAAANLDDEKAWCELSMGRSLGSFLSEDDHVRAIKNYFVHLLQDVKAFKKSTPKLPWSASGADDAEET